MGNKVIERGKRGRRVASELVELKYMVCVERGIKSKKNCTSIQTAESSIDELVCWQLDGIPVAQGDKSVVSPGGNFHVADAKGFKKVFVLVVLGCACRRLLTFVERMSSPSYALYLSVRPGPVPVWGCAETAEMFTRLYRNT